MARPLAPSLLAAVVAALALACGGGGGGDAGPPLTSQAVTCSQTVQVTVTTAGGFVPATLSVPGGGCVRITSGDAGPHDPKSDPHPSHGDCPELNAPAPLAAGESFTARMAGGPKTCGLHDNLNPALVGTVTVTSAAPTPQPVDGLPGY